MTPLRQGWLVSRRELRERLGSRGLWLGTAGMLVVVVVAIVAPTLTGDDAVTKDVGLVGDVPDRLGAVVVDQGEAVDVTVRIRTFDDRAEGEAAVRGEDVDVLVDGRRLLWRGNADERLRAVVAGAIQLVAVQERAAAEGITPDQLAALAEPVQIESDDLGIAAGRSDDDETAAYVMGILLLVAMATYGQLVLTGVVQEKSSRVVEVLLARMPATSLLGGKVAGIGLIGLLQLAIISAAALAATVVVERVDIPAISAGVLGWVAVWFVLGYVMFAVAYGAFGSLASRTEDASSISAPVNTVLIAGYWASTIAVSSDVEGTWAVVASHVPMTAPFAMPARVALGVAEWWEPILAAGVAAVATAGLVVVAGRIYTGAILRTRGTTKLRDAWRASVRPAPPAG